MQKVTITINRGLNSAFKGKSQIKKPTVRSQNRP